MVTNSSTPPPEEPNMTAGFLEDRNRERVSILAPYLVYLVLLMVFGLAGNTTVFVIYYRRFKPSSSRTFVLTMSLCDLLTNVWALVTEMADAFFPFTFYAVWFCKVSKMVMGMLVLFSGLVLVAVAVERQKVVCGMYTRNQPMTRMVRVSVCACCVLALLLSLPRVELYGSHAAAFNGSNITGVQCSIQDAYLASLFPLIYSILNALLFVVIVVIMAVCYGRVGVHIWMHRKRTRGLCHTSVSLSPVGSHSHARTGSVLKSDMDSSTVENHPKTDPKDDDDDSVFEHSPQTKPSSPSSPSSSSSPQSSAHFHRQISNSSGRISTISGKILNGTRRALKMSTLSSDTADVTIHLPSAAKSAIIQRIPSRTTLMLFVLTALFVVNFLPYLILEAMLALEPTSSLWKWNLSVLLVLFRSYYLNSAVNPVVYSFCSARFRYECRRLFRNLWKRVRKQ
ncbi:hypothetical protein ACOMHN_027933 [Nucella lapillus]